MTDNLQQFAERVRVMRKFQKEYFKSRDYNVLPQAKAMEQEVDKALKEILDKQKVEQPNLFNQ